LGPFPRLNPEFVVRANPDLIMLGERSLKASAPYPGWDQLKAVRANRLCLFSVAESDLLVRPGPRMAQAARLLAACVTANAAKPDLADKRGA
jgi:iron complex transport system substrate-binding protein